MTRGRTTTLALGICIGTLLLFLGDALAEVTEASSVATTEKSSSQTVSTVLKRVSPLRANQSVQKKDGQNIDLTNGETGDRQDGSRDSVRDDESPPLEGGRQAEEENDALTSHGATDNATHASSRANKSAEEIADSSDPDGGRKPRYGEISAESSGKSTSTKAVAENPPRLSRTNELTVATVKPALNDSKQDSKRNPGNNATLQESLDPREGTSNTTEEIVLPNAKEKLVNGDESTASVARNPELKRAGATPATNDTLPEKYLVSSREEAKRNATAGIRKITTVNFIRDSTSPRPRTPEDAVKSDGKTEKTPTKSDYKETAAKKERNATVSDMRNREEPEYRKSEESQDRELTTMRGVPREDSPESKRDAIDLGTSASEAFDLEKIDEKAHEDGISLINDTYVNYKTSTEKDARGGSGNQSGSTERPSENGDPKEEVEVVTNVTTHQPILKIISVIANDTKNEVRFGELNSQKEVAYNRKKGESDAKNDESERKVASPALNATDVESTDGASERKSIGKPESQIKMAEITTTTTAATTARNVAAEEQTSNTPKVILSPILQGRTIGFSGVNEYPSVEVKSSTVATMKLVSDKSEVTPIARNTQSIEHKPYPYVKSGKEPFQVTTEAGSKAKDSVSGVTEETSAYENTIGREEGSEKKFIVTEPSVVIENSIQQQQKADERNANGSANSTTESISLVSATVMPILSVDVRPTNETFPGKTDNHAEMKGAKSNESVPDTKKGEEKGETEGKAIAGRSEGYDVTGNGITEVSLIPEADGRGDGKEVKSHSGEAAESSTSRSSKPPRLNTDIQTEPEEAMMIRSTLVVTESTMVPPDTVTEASNKFTASMASSGSPSERIKALDNSTEPTKKADVTSQPSSSANQTAESQSTTLNPDESSIPTTTTTTTTTTTNNAASVEYEFVGLTETISPADNATVRSVEGSTIEGKSTPSKATVQDTSAKSNSTERTITTLKPEESTELPATTEDGTPTTDQVFTTDNETTDVSRNPPVTQPTSVRHGANRTEFTSRSEVTVSAVDFANVITDATGTTAGVTESPAENSSLSEKSPAGPGATGLLPNSSAAVSPAANSTKGPSLPFATSTLESRILWSTSAFTESPEEETTESIQTLSPDEITLLVKIVIEGTVQEVCPHLQDLKEALADVLKNMDRHVLPKQIIIHQNPCHDLPAPSPAPMNIALTPIFVYVVDEDGKFDAVMTKVLPNLYNKMSHNFPVRIHKFLLVQETDSGNAIAVVVVSSVAFICLVLLAGLLFIMRKRQTRFNYGERCRPVSLDAYSLDSVSAYNSVRRKGAARSSKRSYGNPTFEDSSAIPSHPLNFAGLSSFCNDVNAINEEFSNIPQVSAKIDELPTGAEVKNRYANVVPLPETRVPLQRLNNDALTEYINASYVRGPKNATKYYIACQAPIDSTVTDFWRMIWEQQCKVIIMLTDLVENGVEKCTEYIPPSEVTDCHRLYGDHQVTLKKREAKEKYAISTLHLKNLENNTFREVFHIWYLWPVSGVQSDGAGLIAVLLEARALQRGGPGPIVVHCSPGTGRTGTLIALDLGIRQYEITRTVDVPRVVYTIRRDRAGAVQTKEQYAFIYKALNLYATKLAGGVLEST